MHHSQLLFKTFLWWVAGPQELPSFSTLSWLETDFLTEVGVDLLSQSYRILNNLFSSCFDLLGIWAVHSNFSQSLASSNIVPHSVTSHSSSIRISLASHSTLYRSLSGSAHQSSPGGTLLVIDTDCELRFWDGETQIATATWIVTTADVNVQVYSGILWQAKLYWSTKYHLQLTKMAGVGDVGGWSGHSANLSCGIKKS